MMQSKDEKQDLERYTALKKEVELPVKIKLYFLIFDNAIQNSKLPRSIQSKKGFSKALLNAFNNLSSQEKGLYLLNSLNFVLDQLEHQEKEKTKSDSKSQYFTDQIRFIETSCEMAYSTMKITLWTNVSFKLDKILKQITITNKKKVSVLEIKHYYVRKSKKYKSGLVLEAINEDISNENSKYVFTFSSLLFSRIYQEILKCVLHCQNEKIYALFAEDEEEDKTSGKCSQHSNTQKALVFLSSKNINDYISYKQIVQKQITNNKLDFKQIYKIEQIVIQQSYKMETIFKLENVFELEASVLKEKFLYAFNHKNKMIIHSQILEEFSRKYKALYEKFLVNGKAVEFISIRQESLSAKEQVLFIKGVENIMNKMYLQFLQVKVATINPFKSKLLVYCSINLNSIMTKETIKNFLLELSSMILRKESGQLKNLSTEMDENEEEEDQFQDEDEFRTVRGSEEFVQFQEDDIDGDLPSSRLKIEEEIVLSHKIQSNNLIFLKIKHHVEPLGTEGPLMKEHFLFQEWERRKSGGVICTNLKVINLQKSMFKALLANLGTGILKGQIFKLSLPVIIFKKESHLESIARDFCFSPMFFDKLAQGGDTLERVKYATLQAISVGTLGISINKPFNPILGQTFQGWIGGCPIYLEQISHHPPIGSYYLKGRGYTIHGQIQPRIKFGFNNVKGYSDRKNYINFDDGTEIQISYGKMIIKGMLFGERQFNFQEKILAFDTKNNIFSEVNYGPRKKFMTKKRQDPTDFFYGSIYEVTPQFTSKFKSSKEKIYPSKADIVAELSHFEGAWTDRVTFDGVQYINFRTELPYKLVHEQNPLLSHSSFRGDLIKVIEDDLTQAQIEKNKIEQIQRRDRKLRQKYCKN